MELVLIGLSGAGKSAVARALAARTGAELVDLDAEVERRAGRSIAEIFATSGEAAFRTLEAGVVAAMGRPGGRQDGRLRRVIAAGGGSIIEPANRWTLFGGRRVAWLDAPPDVLARRLSRQGEAEVRPLLAGKAAARRLADLGAGRARFYAAGQRIDASGPPAAVVARLEAWLAATTERDADGVAGLVPGRRLLDAQTGIGRIVLGAGIAAEALREILGTRATTGRLAMLSEPVAWRLHGEGLAAALRRWGLVVEPILLPRGEAAKRLRVVERATRALARGRLERGEPIVALGGGALGDAAGFIAATYLRGVTLIHVPTTLLAQLDSSIGGKTAVDLPEGKNLVGAFHQPAAVVIDVAHLTTLPTRQVRAAMGEAAKMAVLGDERLMARLEADGAALCTPRGRVRSEAGLAEIVERAAWAKVEIVSADPLEARPAEGRVRLNLGHSFGHAIEAAAGYRGILHGEAVAHGLRGAVALGSASGLTPPDRAARITALLDRLGLAVRPAPVDRAAVIELLGRDKKVVAGRLRWIVPTADGVTVTTDVPEHAVEAGLVAALAGREEGPGDGGSARAARAARDGDSADRGRRR